jgi:hypothetical protein
MIFFIECFVIPMVVLMSTDVHISLVKKHSIFIMSKAFFKGRFVLSLSSFVCSVLTSAMCVYIIQIKSEIVHNILRSATCVYPQRIKKCRVVSTSAKCR